ncbi:MAG: type III-B CRISPR module-associated Cmr3 family protein, partial [Myxococcota bacterium]
MTATTWWIEPLEPVVFGDGRPNTLARGTTSRSRVLPPPSQLAGAVRSIAGMGPDGRFDVARRAEVARYAVSGPILGRRTGGAVAPWWPAPADAVVFDLEGGFAVDRAVPAAIPDGAVTSADDLHGSPVVGDRKDKPSRRAPLFWDTRAMVGWLVVGFDRETVDAKHWRRFRWPDGGGWF